MYGTGTSHTLWDTAIYRTIRKNVSDYDKNTPWTDKMSNLSQNNKNVPFWDMASRLTGKWGWAGFLPQQRVKVQHIFSFQPQPQLTFSTGHSVLHFGTLFFFSLLVFLFVCCNFLLSLSLLCLFCSCTACLCSSFILQLLTRAFFISFLC